MGKRFVCSNCGFIGKPANHIKGSFLIELSLWGIVLPGFLFMGLIGGIVLFVVAVGYSLYRAGSRSKGCPKCKAPNMIPEDTPKGQELINRSPVKS